MVRSLILACAGALALTMVSRAQQPTTPPAAPTPAPPTKPFVILDASVLDKEGRPVTDLRQEEFEVEDDGKRYKLTNFARISLQGNRTATDVRTIALVLDDAGVPAGGTQSIQAIATRFMGTVRPADAVSVIRLHAPADGLFPRFEISMGRIAGYQGGAIPFFQDETPEDMLRMVSRLSGEWEKMVPRRRRAIVCVGSQAVCNIDERESTAARDLYTTWVDALNAAARAQVVFYAAIPALSSMSGGGLIERTGGEMFSGSYDFNAAAARVVAAVSEYYLLGYEPEASRKDLRPLTVRVSRQDVKVHTRNRR